MGLEMPTPDTDLAALEERIGHGFENCSLLRQALTHASAATGTGSDNERLEFLGDSVVSLAVNDHLYRYFTQSAEGTLTVIKSAVVSTTALSRRARALELGRLAVLGKGMPRAGSLSDSVLANLFEAVVGALYIDAGFERARDFVMAELAEEIEAAADGSGERNYKAALQQICSRRWNELPRYQVLTSTGPDHAKTFEVAAAVGERTFKPASGRTKKEAEQRAAEKALAELEGKTGTATFHHRGTDGTEND
jgi:ribonuclease-3